MDPLLCWIAFSRLFGTWESFPRKVQLLRQQQAKNERLRQKYAMVKWPGLDTFPLLTFSLTDTATAIPRWADHHAILTACNSQAHNTTPASCIGCAQLRRSTFTIYLFMTFETTYILFPVKE